MPERDTIGINRHEEPHPYLRSIRTIIETDAPDAAHPFPRRTTMRASLLSTLLLACLGSPTRGAAQPIAREIDVDASSYTSVVQESYPDGKPRVWKQLRNGKAEGLWLEWHTNGALRFRSWWRDSKGDGRWEYFYPSGRLRSESTYSADEPIGLEREYHENGIVKAERTYVKGKQHGVTSNFDVSGTPTAVQRWEYGVRLIDRPELFAPGVISTRDNSEWGLTFSPDGDTTYFTRRVTGGSGQRIYRSVRTASGWDSPRVAEFSTAVDEGASISRDGARLYFASTRPLAGRRDARIFDMNLWVMDRTPRGWSAPQALPASINRSMTASTPWPANYEAGPATDSAGNLYYWTGSATSKDADLFFARRRADGSFDVPRALAMPPNHRGFDSAPRLSPDGRYLVFASSGREDGFGGEDLYVAKREGVGWSVPMNLGPDINDLDDASCAAFSPDGKYFFFCSNREQRATLGDDAPWSIYYIEARFLMLPK